MKVLLLGAEGQIGHELRMLLSCFAQVVAETRVTLDLEKVNLLVDAVGDIAPDLVINAAAYTNVDLAERERDRAFAINSEAVRTLGLYCEQQKVGLIHFSTDFVFDGSKGFPYCEDDPTGPLNIYGESKLAGEVALAATSAMVFRTAWVYSLRRKSFVSTMLRLMREQEHLRVVDDQVGNPTACRDVAVAIAMVAFGARPNPFAWLRERRGIYHLAGSGDCSRFELAKAIAEYATEPLRVKTIEPVATSAYPLPAVRPADSRLDCAKAERVLGLKLPHWRESLGRMLAR